MLERLIGERSITSWRHRSRASGLQNQHSRSCRPAEANVLRMLTTGSIELGQLGVVIAGAAHRGT